MDEAPPRIRSEALAAQLADSDQPCHACGHNLRGVQEVVCPECGTVVAAPIPGRAPAPRAAAPGWVRGWRWINSSAAVVLMAAAFARLVGLSAAPVARASAGGLIAAATMAAAVLTLHAAVGIRRAVGLGPPRPGAQVLLGALGSALAVLSLLALL